MGTTEAAWSTWILKEQSRHAIATVAVMNQPRHRAGTRSSTEPRDVVSEWLTEFGDTLFAYARNRVESIDAAEELVQETFLAALRNFDKFERRASPQTWLTAILRNKIIEHYRKRHRRKEIATAAVPHPDNFDAAGIWKISLGPWPRDPSQVFEDQEFWLVLEDCLSKLPPSLADVFMMRVLDGLETTTICKEQGISPSNLAVRLHRARLSLRDCLGKHWFGDE